MVLILLIFRTIVLILSILKLICPARPERDQAHLLPADPDWPLCGGQVWQGFSTKVLSLESKWGASFIPTEQAPPQQSQPNNNRSRNVPGVWHDVPFHFPAERNLSGVCGGIVLLRAADGLILNTGPLPATFPGLKTSCSQRLWGAVAQLYEEQASCRMLKPRLNYTGDSGSLSLSSERMNQMIPLLVSHQLFSSCCTRQNVTSWGMWPHWTAPRGNYRCIQIEFVPLKSCPSLLSWNKYME